LNDDTASRLKLLPARVRQLLTPFLTFASICGACVQRQGYGMDERAASHSPTPSAGAEIRVRVAFRLFWRARL
jgi:hypothetical protein